MSPAPRGHAAGQNNVVMLPPEGEQVTKDGNYEPVLVTGHNENDKAADRALEDKFDGGQP
mgnify:CR=1 FL=1